MDNHHHWATTISRLGYLCAGCLCLWPILPTTAKGLVGKLPGNPASCPEEPCNSDPQHVLQALKWTSLAFGLILLLPLLMYYISKLISKLHSLCSSDSQSESDIKKQVEETKADLGDSQRGANCSKARREEEKKRKKRQRANVEGAPGQKEAEQEEEVAMQSNGSDCIDEQDHQEQSAIEEEQEHHFRLERELLKANGNGYSAMMKSSNGAGQRAPKCISTTDTSTMTQEADSRRPSYSSGSRNQKEQEPPTNQLQMLDADESALHGQHKHLHRSHYNNQTPDHSRRYKSSSQKSNSRKKGKLDDNLASSQVSAATLSSSTGQHRRSIQVAEPQQPRTLSGNLQSPLFQLNVASYLDQIHRKSFSNVTELELFRSPYLVRDEQQQQQASSLEQQQRARLNSMLNVDQLVTYQRSKPGFSVPHKSHHPGKVYPAMLANPEHLGSPRDDESWVQVEADARRSCSLLGRDALASSEDYLAMDSEGTLVSYEVQADKVNGQPAATRVAAGKVPLARHHRARQAEVEEESYQTAGRPIQQDQNTLALPGASSSQQHRHSIDGSILNRMAHRMQQGSEQVSNFNGTSDLYCYNNNEASSSISQLSHPRNQQRGSAFAGGGLANKEHEPSSAGRLVDRSRPGSSGARRTDRRDH